MTSTDGNNTDVSDTSTGKERSVLLTVCPYILGTELGERLAYYGVKLNMVNYAKRIGATSSTAASAVQLFSGSAYLTPLLGGWIADAHLGRYLTILLSTMIYVFGMLLLAGSVSIPGIRVEQGHRASDGQWALLTLAFGLIVVGTGGIKPNVSAFGADQFNDDKEKERKEKASFFNWFYFFINVGAMLATTVLVYIQDQGMWSVSYGITSVVIILSGCLFVLGKPLYQLLPPTDSPLSRFFRITYTAVKNRLIKSGYTSLGDGPETTTAAHEAKAHWLENAVGEFSAEEVNDVKLVYRMAPVFFIAILAAISTAPMSALLLLQTNQMDRNVTIFGHHTRIPSASMEFFNTISLLLLIPLYDRVLLPLLRKWFQYTPTQLQRVGAGLVSTVLTIFVAFWLERQRLDMYEKGQFFVETREGKEVEVVKMSVWWAIVPHFFDAVSELTSAIGLIHFFYSEAPDSMKSMMSALNLIPTGISSYLMSFVLYLIDVISSSRGAQWLPDNLNKGHLDLLFLSLAGFAVCVLCLFLHVANHYEYKKSAEVDRSCQIPLTLAVQDKATGVRNRAETL